MAGAALLVFLPSSNLLFAIGTVMAERFLYLPAIAFAAGIVAAIGKAGRIERPAVLAALGLIGLAWAGRAWTRNLDWRDDLSIGRATVAASPQSFKAHKLLAYALHEGGAGNLAEAIDEAEKGLVPLKGLDDSRSNADSYLRTGGYYAERGDELRARDPEAGKAAYHRALELLLKAKAIATAQTTGEADPARFGPLMEQIAEVQGKLGNAAGALEAAMEARRRDPGNPEIHRRVARVLLSLGRADEAAAALMEGVIVTADNGLREDLLRMYTGGLDRLGCATMQVQGHEALNPGCETVRRNLCAAAVGTMRLRVETGRQDLADAMRQTALTDFRCTAEELR